MDNTMQARDCKLENHLPVIERMVHQLTWRLVRSGRVQSEDRSDFAQDLMLHVVKAWPQLAESDFEPLGFVRLVIRQKSLNEIRRRKGQLELPSIVETQPAVSGDAMPLGIEDMVAELSSEDQGLVALLVELGQIATIKQLGIDRNELMRRLRSIRKQLLLQL